MHVEELETPSVLIDLPIMEANIRRMQARCDSLGLDFRPHIKTHKIPEIARMQIEAGAVGLACQKVSEAQVFVDDGFDNIQIPYNIVGQKKTRKLAELAERITLTTIADHPDTVRGLSDAAREQGIKLRVMADLVTDIQRTGAGPQDVLKLAQLIDSDPHLHFAGILVYPSFASARPSLQEALDLLDKAGIDVESVSGGGVGAILEAEQLPELTEMRVGTYLFNDWGTVVKGWTSLENCAMKVAATVVSRPAPDRAILDSGSKTLAADRVNDGHGYLVEYPDAQIYQLNEEHAYVDLSACEGRPAIGDRVHVIPVHTCVVSNLHNQLYGVRVGQVEVVWQVAARGLVW